MPLTDDSLTLGRGRFAAFSPAEMRDAAVTLVRYRIASSDVRDLREGKRHFSPQQTRSRPNAKDSLYEEAAITSRMATFSVGLSSLSALLKQNQDMDNAISLELARVRIKVPAYTPFIYQRISEPPWPISTNGHSDAIAKWRRNTRLTKRDASSLAVPTHAWILYQLRFLITAELLGALTTFGGFLAGINHLSIVLNIDTTETIDVSLDYGRLVKQLLAEKARARAETAIGDGYFGAFLSAGNSPFRIHAISECAPLPALAEIPTHVPKNSQPAERPPRQPRRWNRGQPAASPLPRRRRSPDVRSRAPKRRPRTPARRVSRRKKQRAPR